MEFLSNPFLYLEYIIVVILTTEIIKKQTNWHPKWITLVIGAVWAGIGISMNFFVLHEAPSFWKLFISYLSANFFYTYFLKPIKKLFGADQEETEPVKK